ncbi:hypothetical protein ACN9MB_12985 [Dyella kyungheensis]|uniref:hypothetical protein n=1 Tax=Dyella kyungheensis TaxID=1242174 RepID=UPI003CE72EC5
MAKFSELPNANTPDGSELLAISQTQSGDLTSAKLSLSVFVSWFRGLTTAWTKNQVVTPVKNATATGTVTLDASASNNFRCIMTGNVTLANPSNLADGMVLNIQLVQDGTGSRTLSFGSKFKWAGGSPPTWATAANSVNFISAYYDSTLDVLLANGSAGYA